MGAVGTREPSPLIDAVIIRVPHWSQIWSATGPLDGWGVRVILIALTAPLQRQCFPRLLLGLPRGAQHTHAYGKAIDSYASPFACSSSSLTPPIHTDTYASPIQLHEGAPRIQLALFYSSEICFSLLLFLSTCIDLFLLWIILLTNSLF
jgi:hypothetical protein